ncbi:hypothetical protein L596_010504 [Steinernema carpocapsae]|uniref:SKP1 component POZ domain-containing protein n=1 Tax=Steinernema carpocapsae TaxID=34508 RepID=A0A4V6A6X1_STECR|nr:hypothetical protein L596_010504 [Steinernema carpocapsae]
MTEQTIKISSSDDQVFEIKPKHLNKSGHLKLLLECLGYVEGANIPQEPVPINSVSGRSLQTIVAWLNLHNNDEPKDASYLRQHKFERTVSEQDNELFDNCTPKAVLVDLIDAAYFLEMPDLVDTLVKYTANNLDNKSPDDMRVWMEIPSKSNVKK